MQFADYYESAAPDRYVVLGVTLRPLSLGHLILLQRVKSPYVLGLEAEASNDDLILGILICGLSFEAATDKLFSGAIHVELAQWRKRLTRRQWFKRKWTWIDAHQIFQEYLHAGMLIPKFWRSDESKWRPGAPPEQMLKIALMKIGFSESEALNKSLSMCWFDVLTNREMETAEHILYDEQDAQLSALAKG